MSLEILKKYRIKAKKSLGQNFLVNEAILEEISDFIDIKGKHIIEVGPGYGALTEKLCLKKPRSLDLVELDRDMISILEDRIKNMDFDLSYIDFKINNIDVIKYIPKNKDYSVIANIPYYITSPILRHFLYDLDAKPEKMLILMQKDVADKINGKGKNKSSVLSLFIAKKCNTKEVLFVGRNNFIPVPKVESSVLLFEIHDLYNEINDIKFLEFIKKAFKEPRKKLSNNLITSGFEKEKIMQIFSELGFDENVRGEDLTIDDFVQFMKKF